MAAGGFERGEETSWTVDDIPVAAGTPLEITLERSTVAVVVTADAGIKYVFAATSAAAVTAFAGGSYRPLPAGTGEINAVGQNANGNNLYIEHRSGGPTTNGIGYALVRGSQK